MQANIYEVCDHLSAAKLNSRSAIDLAPIILHIPTCISGDDATQCTLNFHLRTSFAYLHTHTHTHTYPCFYTKLFPLQAFTTHSLNSRSTHIYALSVSLLACRDQPLQMHLSPYVPQTITHHPLHRHLLSLLSNSHFKHHTPAASPAPIP